MPIGTNGVTGINSEYVQIPRVVLSHSLKAVYVKPKVTATEPNLIQCQLRIALARVAISATSSAPTPMSTSPTVQWKTAYAMDVGGASHHRVYSGSWTISHNALSTASVGR